jgi:hypothetical protein
MSSKLLSGLLTICFLGFAIPAVAQLDSSALRAKFGPPLNRETFHMPEGFDLVVDYDAANQACKMEVPALMPTNAKVGNSQEMKKRMYDFLADLVPAAMRGKELGTLIEGVGMISFSSTEYEHITIIEVQHAVNNTITVTFKNCETRPLQ